MSKAFRAAFGIVLVLAVIAVGAVSLSLGKLVKAGVEAAGPRILGAPVTLGSATIAPWSGRGTLSGLIIGNPAGYKSPSSVSAGSIELDLKLASLLSDTIVVEKLVIRRPEVVWELGPSGSNLSVLQNHARGGSSSPAAKPEKKGKSLLIKELVITGGRVGLNAASFGAGSVSAPLPDVRLTNLGGPGRSPADAAAEAFGALTGSAQRAAAGLGAGLLDSLFKRLR